jgi:predicted nucleotidyltransferase
MDKILEIRDKALTKLANKLKTFYLAGGTALSLFYFRHRESYDLDFFTKDFSIVRVEEIMTMLSEDMELTKELMGEENRQGLAKMMVYSLLIDSDSSLKIDFVEDFYNINCVREYCNRRFYRQEFICWGEARSEGFL